MIAVLAFTIAMACSGAAYAQPAAGPPFRRIDFHVGGGIVSATTLGSADANLRANSAARQPFPLFSTESRVPSAATFHARAGFAFSRRAGIEGGLTFSRPYLRTLLTADVEQAPSLTAAERIDEYLFDASLVVALDELRMGARTVPFIVAGGGYLRQLHEGLTVIEHGQVYHAGGGVKHWLMARDRGFVSGVGLRADARVHLIVGGIDLEDRPRSQVAISGSAFLTF